jgi:NAD(P)-dependent dehydrogenase (short-subunit alcohol dehydrogenase family)
VGVLDGKVALVTGAGRGMGRAYALAMADEGARVVVNNRTLTLAEEVVELIRGHGGDAVANGGDVASWDDAGAMVQQAIDAFGQLDVLVNNAGVLRDRMSFNMSEDEWDEVIAVHLTGTFNAGRHAMTHMRERRAGVIINTTSGQQYGGVGQSNYSAAKGGTASLTYTWAMELARYGIRVNCIWPRARTRMTLSTPAAQRQGGLPDAFGDPEHVAPMVVYLASDDADWVTGQVVGIQHDRIWLIQHPKDGAEAFKDGGWSVQDLRERFRATIGRELEPLGQRPRGYRWYDGVRPQDEG